MKHIAPTTVRPAPSKVKYVHDLLTGRVITSRTVGTSPWNGQWIFEAVAVWNECDVDDLATVETDDGEFIALKGKPVAEVRVN